MPATAIRGSPGVYSHVRDADLAEAGNRLQIPGAALAASPFAHLNRDALERVTLGLCVMLGTLLSPDPTTTAPVALRVAPAVGISGDSWALDGANDSGPETAFR
jgi:hypothetical protein